MGEEQQNTDVIQGTLDMLILKALSLEPMHGFGIARRIEQTSRGVFKVNPGSLLTAFQRLERGGADRRGVASDRQGAARQVLHADARGTATARGRDGELDAPGLRGRAAAEGGRLADVPLAPADARARGADESHGRRSRAGR